ncbi:hypothetical protein OSB04_000276 [Centaurea solstitialis]|uniref:ACB domain-containing protein n=1 Tax=Centaurea solstitialis TaxID=347529 RepID=A0AA38U0H7_9ASTR|nr:hypothetical protein OSB04_000276 [Centaurea solstitialis]
MELFQELLFTISLSLIVSLLMVKLFSLASGFEDGNSMVSKRVEEKMEKEWVVCESEKEEKVGYFDDAVEVSEEVGYGGYGEGELGSGFVIDGVKSVGEVGACYVFDESPERKDDVVGCVIEGPKSVGEVGACHVFDESPERKDDVVGSVVDDPKSVGEVGARYVFDESPQRKDDAVSLVESGEVNVRSFMEEDCVESVELPPESAAVDGGGGEVKVEEGDGGFYDDWQGIETTELEKRFGAGVAFMGSKISADRLSLIDNEVKLQLYGLHKVALEGACFESQPMALKISARANWNAWKRLENLGREEAMAQYIALLSRHVPDWMGNHACEDNMQDFVATETPGKLHSDEETPTRAKSER